jgi:type II secretory ATPase GspE/PulE/Tfp pilus assembly ATPase PilB-like protein
VMIGEIRDAETAAIAIQAALTGHLVLSTLHTNDAPGAVHRLVDMGVERYLLAPALRCIVAQRLVARVCRSCARPAEAEPETLAALGLPSGLDMTGLQVGDGCEDCRGKGRRGRMPIHEVLSFDTNLRRLITRGADEEAFLKAALQHDYQPLVRDGVAKAKAGLVPLHEVLGAARLG